MSKHVNIPIFIPHLGCPHHCVFCDQKKITGQQDEVTLLQAEEIIEKHLATIRLPREQIEIAYFGGINKCKSKGKIVPGDKVRLETKIIKQKGPVGVGEAIASVDGKTVVSAELTFMIG